VRDAATKVLQQIQRETRNVDVSVRGASQGVSVFEGALVKLGAAAAAYLSVQQINQFADESVAAFEEAEKTTLRLTFALERNTDATAAQIKEFEQLAQTLSMVSSFTDDQIKSSVAILANYGATQDEIKTLLPSILDLAVMSERTTGGQASLEAVTKSVAMALNGQAGSMGRSIGLTDEFGQAIDDATTKTERFNLVLTEAGKYHGLAAEDAKTLTGELNLENKEWEEQKELIGKDLIPLYTDLAKARNFLGEGFHNAVQSSAVQTAALKRELGALGTIISTIPGINLASTAVAAQAKALVEARYIMAIRRPRDSGASQSAARPSSPASMMIS
jgi:hypothetical protein